MTAELQSSRHMANGRVTGSRALFKFTKVNLSLPLGSFLRGC